ncbi:ATP/GTP-binding protein OS=Streptomyces cyaneofuscatus OX=66883 GN=G3I52_26315 PE=4 SV=1 [Streptomyces cyaneofuscatus]
MSRGQPFLALAAAVAAGLTQLLVWKETLPVVRPVLVLVAAVAGGEIYQSQTVVNVIYALIAAAVLTPSPSWAAGATCSPPARAP